MFLPLVNGWVEVPFFLNEENGGKEQSWGMCHCLSLTCFISNACEKCKRKYQVGSWIFELELFNRKGRTRKFVVKCFVSDTKLTCSKKMSGLAGLFRGIFRKKVDIWAKGKIIRENIRGRGKISRLVQKLIVYFGWMQFVFEMLEAESREQRRNQMGICTALGGQWEHHQAFEQRHNLVRSLKAIWWQRVRWTEVARTGDNGGQLRIYFNYQGMRE